jgi:hypothetical protein
MSGSKLGGARPGERPLGGVVTFPSGVHNGHVSPVLAPPRPHRRRGCGARR